LDFVFRDVSRLSKDSLSQGDILAKTPEVIERVGQAHQYYASAADYTHFMVLTQSCDLVKRRGQFKAPYITIAAVRPLKSSLDSFLEGLSKKIERSDFTYRPVSAVDRAKQLIERHINNTEDDFFFLPQSGHPGLPEDLVVFLRLSIALRKEHYDALAEAKIAELDDVFQAKLGWLKGNIYSRVATPDIEDRGLDATSIKKSFFSKYIPVDNSAWLSGLQAQMLRSEVKKRAEELKRDLTSAEVIKILEDEIPNDIDIIGRNIVSRLVKNGLIDATDKELQKEFAKAITNESTLKSMINERK
jgi:hypothetical protein